MVAACPRCVLNHGSRQVVDQLIAKEVRFDRLGIAYRGRIADPQGKTALRIGDYGDYYLGEDLIALRATDASAEGWIAIFVQEISDGERRNVFTKLVPPAHARACAAAAVRKADLWLQSTHTCAERYPVTALEQAVRTRVIPLAPPAFTEEDVDAVYWALYVSEQNRSLDDSDGQSLCAWLGVRWAVVKRGLSLLERTRLVAAAQPEAFEPSVQETSAIIQRASLTALGRENRAFALQRRTA